MEYKMEELLPIVEELAQKYTSGESSSITYERAAYLAGNEKVREKLQMAKKEYERLLQSRRYYKDWKSFWDF